jgi:hypothetical protein
MLTLTVCGQQGDPVRTEWRDPDGKQPETFREWNAENEGKFTRTYGSVVYRSHTLQRLTEDSISFGEDYAYVFAMLYHANNDLCTEEPPVASFYTYLNGDDSYILTDDSPRWKKGDPNISGMGWIGCELGNFSNPAVAPGDSFDLVFSCYKEGDYGRKVISGSIDSLPLFCFPQTVTLEQKQIPLPPQNIRLERAENGLRISWESLPGLEYSIYRRPLSDTLTVNFHRFEYKKIIDGLIDSTYLDTAIDTTEAYAYLMFAYDPAADLMSGRSRDIPENIISQKIRAVIVQPELYSGIALKLDQLVSDWESEGADVIVYSMQFESPEALRDTLASIGGLGGALLIGDLPVPWFQFESPDGTSYQEYPCDLFYMDLDGTWQDNLKRQNGTYINGSDGIYDAHFGVYPYSTERPEIVIGRITPTPQMGNAVNVINYYLTKVHEYRHNINDMRNPFTALSYADDDWHDWGRDVGNDFMRPVFQEVDNIYDINQTTGTGYKNRLSKLYHLLHVYVHSSSGGHSFTINNGTSWEWVRNTDILPEGANANFYILFACGNSRYTSDYNCGGVYTLLTTKGINSIGTTHSGGMLAYDTFYPALGRGLSYGEAYFYTLQQVGYLGFNSTATGWYYGMTFNGDPFVVPQHNIPLSADETTDIPADYSISAYPNPFNPNTTISFSIPENGKVSVTIYNVLGAGVAELLNENLNAGKHTVSYSPGNLASGVYICTITHLPAKGNNAVRKSLKLLYLK